MDDAALADVYYRTTLELADDHGTIWQITPASTDGDDPGVILGGFSDAYILTAENPESSGEYSSEENAAATAALAHELNESGVTYRPCPGYGFDVDHVEHGFAILATAEQSGTLRDFTLELARRYRQNAIFHLHGGGLGIVGALRPGLNALRAVEIRQAH